MTIPAVGRQLPFNIPPNSPVSINVNPTVRRLEFQPIMVTGAGNAFFATEQVRLADELLA